jgi:3-oxoadipate enol-lactonase
MDQREAIKTVTVPTLVVIGERDPATPPERGREIHGLIPGSRLAALDAAHLSNIEQTAAFNRTVIDFLTQ